MFGLVARDVFNHRQQRAARGGHIDRIDAAHRDLVHLFGDGHELLLQRATGIRQVNVNVLAAVRQFAPLDIAELFHRNQRRERGGLHQPRLLAQFTLRKSLALPQNAQKHPMAKGDVVARKPRQQGPLQAARGVLDQMGQTVVGHRLAPMAQNDRGLREHPVLGIRHK